MDSQAPSARPQPPAVSLFLLLYSLAALGLALVAFLWPGELVGLILAIGPVLYAAFHYPRRVYIFMIFLAVLLVILDTLLVAEDIPGTLLLAGLVALTVGGLAEMAHHLVAERAEVERRLEESQNYFRSLFENSPISLWDEDFSQVKAAVDEMKAQGIRDFRTYLRDHPDVVYACADVIIVRDVNRASLPLVHAESKDQLLANVHQVLGRTLSDALLEEVVAIAEGRTFFEWEGVNDIIEGVARYHRVTWSVAPGSEGSYRRVIVAIEDITESKRTEEALLFLSTHDMLTGLFNRAYFDSELNRLNSGRMFPVTIFFADMDGLKLTNDNLGHAAGDGLLRRAARVLRAAFRVEDVVARIGGDEFGVILPQTDEAAAAEMRRRVLHAIDEHNQAGQEPPVRFSMGLATAYKGEDLHEAVKTADERMYADKAERRRAAPPT